MKKFLFIVSLSLLLSGCGTSGPIRVDIPEAARTLSVPTEDLRPESEKQGTLFSSFVMSSSYGIYRNSDDALDPKMIDIFRWMVYERLGNANGDLKISVYHMIVYVNMKSALRSQAIGGALGGIIGATIASMANGRNVNIAQSLVDREQFEKIKPEVRRAFYTKSENPEKASVFVIYIDASVNGKRLFVKTMAPVTHTNEGYILAMQSAIQYYLDQYVEQVGEKITIPPPPKAPNPDR
jgi:hypothetical protein